MEDLYDDLADMMADQEEIQEVMGRSYQVDYDESELMGGKSSPNLFVKELEELDSEIVNEQLSDGFSVPSYIPQKPQAAPGAPIVASSQPNEADQL